MMSTIPYLESGCVALPEAGGYAANAPQDASEGMQVRVDADGQTWAWNPAMDQWQLLHRIVSGDTLWQMSRTYYGDYSLEGVRAIHNVPQNRAIQGDSPDFGLIPGDVILIPDLSQFFDPPQVVVEDAEPPPPAPPSPAPPEVTYNPPPDPPPPPPPPTEAEVIAVSNEEGARRQQWSTGKKVAAAAGVSTLLLGGLWLASRKRRR